MKRLLIAAGVALLSVAVAPAFAQERPNPGAGSQGTAVERGAPPSSAPSMPSAPAPSSVGSSGGGSGSSSPDPGGWSGGEHRAAPRAGTNKGTARPRSGSGSSAGGTAQGGRTGATAGSGGNQNDPGVGYAGARPRGPHPAQGTAVARTGDISPLPPYWQGGYWDYYYWFPYYGPWGLYFYWDPYMWGDYYPGAYGGAAYGGGTPPPAYYNDEDGSLKLKVKPRTAQVYLDGYLVGIVDDYDGVFQKLKAPSGGHRLEIRQEGYKPLTVQVMVQPDATTTFRGELEPLKK